MAEENKSTEITGKDVQKVKTTSNGETVSCETKRLFGRRIIYSSETQITKENVVKVLEQAYVTHLLNRGEIDYLWKYYEGNQPILYRKKEVRPEICNKVVENRAAEIVDFKVGYSYGEPIQYVAKNDKKDVSKAIDDLNDYMDVRSRASIDVELAKWQMVGGLGYKLALPSLIGDEDSPFDVCIPDPRDAFVIYDNTIRHKPLAGVVYTTDPQTNDITYGVYTVGMYYEIRGGVILRTQPLYLPGIPLVEYPLNLERIGAFEVVIGMLDAINRVDSNRLDGVEQFIQSLAVAVNCQFKDGTTANQIREAGMIILKSVGENKADFKILAEQLNQSETQTLKEDMLRAVREICGVPSQGNSNTGDSSNNGAVILRNGWQAAEARAKAYELMFRKSEMEFLKIVLAYCDLNVSRRDIQIKFTRRQYEDIYTKAQVLNMLLGNNLVHPKVAYTVSGMFSDVEDAYKMGIEWDNKQEKKQPQEKTANNDGHGVPNAGGGDTE